MSSILCLWKYKNYLADMEKGLPDTPAFNSNQSRLHDATELGDVVYAVTYLNGSVYLIGRIVIRKKGYNPPDYKYGQFRIEGNAGESTYFRLGTIDITSALRRLEFTTRKPIGNSRRPLALHLQTFRELTDCDVALIEKCI